MLFLRKLNQIIIFKNLFQMKISKIEFSLQVRKCAASEKAFFFTSRRMKGSLTVEAAFVMPIVIFVVAVFSYLMMAMGLQLKMQEAVDTAGKRLAGYAFVYQKVGELAFDTEEELMKDSDCMEVIKYGLSSAYAWKLVREYNGEDWLNHFLIKNGENGVWLSSGDILSEEDVIDLVLHYTIKIPYLPGEKICFPMTARCRMKAWTGYEIEKESTKEEKTEEQIVYITDTGRVYHTNKNCTHLKLCIEQVEFANVQYLRNQSGAKFYACEKCLKTGIAHLAENQMVYITKTGTSYHEDRKCSGLKRSIREIPISQADGRTKCKRCVQTEEK